MRRQDKMPARNKKNFRPTKKGAGMTKAGVAAYRRANPGSKLKTAVTGKVKPGSKAAKRRKSFCARSAGQMKKFPKAAKDPNSRLRQARRRWKCQQILLKKYQDQTKQTIELDSQKEQNIGRRNMKKQKAKIKKVMKALKKASKAHAGQAKILKGVIHGGSKNRNGKKA